MWTVLSPRDKTLLHYLRTGEGVPPQGGQFKLAAQALTSEGYLTAEGNLTEKGKTA